MATRRAITKREIEALAMLSRVLRALPRPWRALACACMARRWFAERGLLDDPAVSRALAAWVARPLAAWVARPRDASRLLRVAVRAAARGGDEATERSLEFLAEFALGNHVGSWVEVASRLHARRPQERAEAILAVVSECVDPVVEAFFATDGEDPRAMVAVIDAVEDPDLGEAFDEALDAREERPYPVVSEYAEAWLSGAIER